MILVMDSWPAGSEASCQGTSCRMQTTGHMDVALDIMGVEVTPTKLNVNPVHVAGRAI